MARCLMGISCLPVIAMLAAFSPTCRGQNAVNIVARAVICFNNMTVINNCQRQLKVAASGKSANSTGSICNGPCMHEMLLVLTCVDGALSNFRFYKGAATQAIGRLLRMPCLNANTTTAGGNATSPRNMSPLAATNRSF